MCIELLCTNIKLYAHVGITIYTCRGWVLPLKFVPIFNKIQLAKRKAEELEDFQGHGGMSLGLERKKIVDLKINVYD